MSVISAIIAAPRRPGRFHIIVAGAAVATLSLDAIQRLGLTVGRDVDGLAESIVSEANELAVHDRAITMLALRARSSVELARALVRKGAPRSIVDRVIARLLAAGLLNDASFARSFARAKILGANHSTRRVQQELARRGVARVVSDAAIEAVFHEEGIDQYETVEGAARKKLRTLGKLEPAVQNRRLHAFLARRGFGADDIRHAMKMVPRPSVTDVDA